MPCLHTVEPGGSFGREGYLDRVAAGTAADIVDNSAGTSRVILDGSSAAEVGDGDSDRKNVAVGDLHDQEILHGGGEGDASVQDDAQYVDTRNPIDAASSGSGEGVREVTQLLPSASNSPINAITGRRSLEFEEEGSGSSGGGSLPPDTTVAPAWCADNCTSSLEDLVCWTKGLDYDAAVRGF